MSGESYLIGWLIYLGAALVFLALTWLLTRKWPDRARLPVRMLLAALVLFPWRAGPEHPELAPAWMVALFDGLVQEDLSLWRAGGPLLAVALLAAALGLAECWRAGRGARHD